MERVDKKEGMPSADQVWHWCRMLVKVAYRFHSGQFEGWRFQKDAERFLGKIAPHFRAFRECLDNEDQNWSVARQAEQFIAIHKEARLQNWSQGKLREELSRMFGHESGSPFFPEDVADELVTLIRNPAKDTPQGVVEDANYTWSQYCRKTEQGFGDTVVKQLRRKLKAGHLRFISLQEGYEWTVRGEFKRFRRVATEQLFGAQKAQE